MTGSKRVSWLIAGLAGFAALFGCGGGGGGAPPADVTGQILYVLSATAPNPAATVNISGHSTTTDTQGYFIMRGVPSDAKQITVSAQGAKTLTQNLPALKANLLNDLGTLYIVASDSDYTANASGTVVRADTQAVVAGASVTLSGQNTTTDAQGKFSFTGLPVGLGTGGEQVGLVKASGFEDKKLFFDFPLAAGDNPLGNIIINPPVGTIPPGPANILGTITLQGQADLSGTVVTLLDQSGIPAGSMTTQSDGKYGFWVIAGQYTVKAEHTGFQTKTQAVTLPSPDQPQTVNLTLTP